MSTILVSIGCATLYQVSLCYGTSCLEACDCTSPTTYYSDCPSGSIVVGCHIYDSSGADAPLGYYSDGYGCYEYGLDGETSAVVSVATCITPTCSCFGYSTVSCDEAGTNYASYC